MKDDVKKRIEKFKKSQDFIDITYFVKHVKQVQYRISLLRELKYNVGLKFLFNETNELNHISVDKKNRLMMQISMPKKNDKYCFAIFLTNY